MFGRLIALVSLGLLLSGCITVPNTLTPDQISSFRLQAVNVSFTPNAFIWWGDGERDYAKSKGQPIHEAERIASSDEGRAYVRNGIATRLRTAMLNGLGPDLMGARPVKIEITVHDVKISSAIERIVFGGDHRMRAETVLMDAKTGSVLLAMPPQYVSVYAGNGLLGVAADQLIQNDPIDRVVAQYVGQYRNWLLRN